MFDIARYLNLYGFKTSHGKEFERRSVEYILENPTYCGMIRWNRTVNETNEIRPKDEWIIADGQQPALTGLLPVVIWSTNQEAAAPLQLISTGFQVL